MTNYEYLNDDLEAAVSDVPYRIANLSNASALLYDALEDINWAGFYLMEDGHLVLGPFQGKLACVEIELGNGVCGKAALNRTALIVPNVHEFDGHIACDSASNSEIVIPIIKDDQVLGVLDIDSPLFDRFCEEDLEGLSRFVQILVSKVF